MSQFRKLLGTLDAASHRRVFWFLFRLCCLASLAFGPCLGGVRTLQEGLAFLSLACGFGAVVGTAFARLRHEPFARGSLNGWDEALAFIAVSRLAHAATLLHG